MCHFKNIISGEFAAVAAVIKAAAHELHAHVNQSYDKGLPYSYHLDMVVDNVMRYADEVCIEDADILPLYFGAYFHDSIEDARLTYNDVTKIAKRFMTDQQAYMAAEIVYALTNEKGRNRAERANERYYEGIRTTPYAPMVKLADRLANMTYSCALSDCSAMKPVYAAELPHFIAGIADPASTQASLRLPAAMLTAIHSLLK